MNADAPEVVAASPMDLTDKNLFAYCDNNPVLRADEGGEFWHLAVGAAVGGLASGAYKVLANLVQKEKWNDGLGEAVLSGAASGLLAATGVGLVGQIAGNAVLSAAADVATQYKERGFSKISIDQVAAHGVVGGIGGALGGKGLGTKALNNLGAQTVKRTGRQLVHQGFRAAATEVKKASAHYMKSAGYVYLPMAYSFAKSNIPSFVYGLLP